jgi:NAD(P)-dependent dehydrogenase (short-subunit alcohol dehydrogenase family)
MILTGKLAIVTGAAQGIGYGVAEGLAADGATVILVDRNAKVHEATSALNAKSPQNTPHAAFVCDVSLSVQVDELFRQIKLVFKTHLPTIVVNNAGIGIDTPLLSTTLTVYESTLDVNLKSVFLVTQAAVKDLVENFPNVKLGKTETYASIICMGSTSAQRGFDGNAGHYAASKAGMEAMMRQYAHELGKYRIRCNAVSPGPIATPTQADPMRAARHVAMTKLGRIGETHEVADLCVFLASDKSSFITGTTIKVDGGFLV